jgi:polyhydroxybutyrate depolymerase
MLPDDQSGATPSRFSEVVRSWKWFLAQSIFLIVFATVSWSAALRTSLVAVIFFGCLLIAAGIATAIHGFWCRSWFGLLFDLFSGISYFVLGFLMVANPLPTGVALTLLIAMLLFIAGICRTVVALTIRSHNGLWLLINSTATLLLAILIWQGWAWWLGTFVTYSLVEIARPGSKPLGPGDYTRSLQTGSQTRSYLIHVPKNYDPQKPTPVVLALHGASMNGPLMAVFSGLNATAEREGFIVVYPNGRGLGCFLFWDASTDDVQFISQVLDDLETLVTVDKQRVYACGMSDGGMMCYLLAPHLSHRIAAIAPVGGTILTPASELLRPVPVLHFHGTADTIIPFAGSVEASIQTWARLNGHEDQPVAEQLSSNDDALKVTRKCYGRDRHDAQVVLVVIEDGGHTWPGQKPLAGFLGKSAMTISANDLMWEFFKNHPLKK